MKDNQTDYLSCENNKWSYEECGIKRRLGIIESSRNAYIIFSSIMFGVAIGYHEFPLLQSGVMVFAIIGYMGNYQLGLRSKHIRLSILRIENTVAGDDSYQLQKSKDVVEAVWSLKNYTSTSCWVFWKV